MAVDLITKMWSKTVAPIQSSDLKKATIEQQEAYQVTVDDPTTTLATILADSNLPSVGDRLGTSY